MTHPGETTAPIQSADLSGIIGRLEKATGPDQGIDAIIYRHLAGNAKDHWFRLGEDYFTDYTIPAITASVDAAIALAERVLPGANRTIRKRYRTSFGRIDGHVYDAQVSGGDACEGVNEAIALVMAVLRALQSKGEA